MMYLDNKLNLRMRKSQPEKTLQRHQAYLQSQLDVFVHMRT